MEYHKCKVPNCETRMSEGTPEVCPEHSQPNDPYHESFVQPFRKWAQEYLDAGRWAGFDYFTAIKTELLERDGELTELNSQYDDKVRELEKLEKRMAECLATLWDTGAILDDLIPIAANLNAIRDASRRITKFTQ